MDTILDQLGLDRTFFYQLVIFAVVFWVLSRIYFRPFMKLLEARRRRTVEDLESAERLMGEAQAKFEEYQKRIVEEKINARKEYEKLLNEAKKEETVLLTQAREEAKKITQSTLESMNQQRAQVKEQLEKEVDQLAKAVSEKLLSRKD